MFTPHLNVELHPVPATIIPAVAVYDVKRPPAPTQTAHPEVFKAVIQAFVDTKVGVHTEVVPHNKGEETQVVPQTIGELTQVEKLPTAGKTAVEHICPPAIEIPLPALIKEPHPLIS